MRVSKKLLFRYWIRGFIEIAEGLVKILTFGSVRTSWVYRYSVNKLLK
jgi:hypothetical protein